MFTNSQNHSAITFFYFRNGKRRNLHKQESARESATITFNRNPE